MKRNNILDAIKGVCILLVILAHFDWLEVERLEYFFPYWMNTTVPIFMMISGYVYTESFQRKEVTTLKQAYALKGITDKAIRYTVPLLLVYTIEVLLIMLIFEKKPTMGEFLNQLWQGGYGPGSYYYLFMMQFIFVFPIIYFVIRKWDFAGLLLCGVANIFYEVIKVPMEMTGDVYRVIVLRYIFAVALGCYFSMGKFQIKRWMAILSFVFGAVFIYAVCYGDYKPLFFYRWSRTSMLAVFYSAPIAYLLIKKCTWECKPLACLGKASYNIFLVQMVFFHLADYIFYGVEGDFVPMLLSYAFCIIAGLWFYRIETPITKKVLSWNAQLFASK